MNRNTVKLTFFKDFSSELLENEARLKPYSSYKIQIKTKDKRTIERTISEVWDINTHNILEFINDSVGLRGGRYNRDFNIIHGKVCDKRNNEYFFGIDSIFNQQFEVCHYN